MIFEMLRWWYVTGWLDAIHRIGQWVQHVEHSYSLSLLLRTLFAPWRRIVTVGAKSFEDKFRAGLDNLVSRAIGFVIRMTVILAAAFSMLAAFLAALLVAIIWPLLPLFAIALLIKGVMG